MVHRDLMAVKRKTPAINSRRDRGWRSTNKIYRSEPPWISRRRMAGRALPPHRHSICHAAPDTGKGAGPSVCTDHAESLRTTPLPPPSHLMVGVENEYHLVGITNKENRLEGRSSGSNHRPNQGLDTMNRTGSYKAYCWPGPTLETLSTILLADICPFRGPQPL